MLRPRLFRARPAARNNSTRPEMELSGSLPVEKSTEKQSFPINVSQYVPRGGGPGTLAIATVIASVWTGRSPWKCRGQAQGARGVVNARARAPIPHEPRPAARAPSGLAALVARAERGGRVSRLRRRRAGTPASAVVRRSAVFGPETFMVRVEDDAMVPGIARGDFVWVDPDEPAVDGSVVLFGHGESAVVRLLVSEGGRRVRSRPAQGVSLRVAEPSYRGLGRLDPGLRRRADRSARKHGSGGLGNRPLLRSPGSSRMARIRAGAVYAAMPTGPTDLRLDPSHYRVANTLAGRGDSALRGGYPEVVWSRQSRSVERRWIHAIFDRGQLTAAKTLGRS